MEGATRVRGEVHVAAPSQLAGLLLAGHHRSLTAFCLLNRKVHPIPLPLHIYPAAIADAGPSNDLAPHVNRPIPP